MESEMTRPTAAQLVLRHDPSKTAALSRNQPLTIGRASTNLLCMPTTHGVAEHHAVVRWSNSNGWLVCDWNSQEGTFLEGKRIRRCRPLNDGDEISLGSRGPVLVFRLVSTTAEHVHEPSPSVATGSTLELGGELIPMDQIQSVQMISRARYPASFSWWALISLGSLVLLPWPLLFWTLELTAVSGWIVLGSRKDHVLLVTLKDGMGYRHGFDSKVTALAHRNGIRKAIGQTDSEPA